MPEVTITAFLNLAPRPSASLIAPCGPTFHRWLPDGEKDAIILPSAANDAPPVRVWFERRATNENGHLRFKWEAKGFDPAVMSQQSPLEAGYLCADAIFADVTDDTLASLQLINDHGQPQDGCDAKSAETFGRRVRKALYNPLRSFVHRLRIEFGQHWLRELRPWDSRRCSLGTYLGGWNAYWQVGQDRESRRPFRPTPGIIRDDMKINRSGDFGALTREDWQYLAATASNPPTFSTGHELLVEAHLAEESGDGIRGMVEAATAVELLVDDALRSAYVDHKRAGTWASKLAADDRIKTAHRLVALCARDPKHAAQVESALQAIELRNKILHDGWRPASAEDEEYLHARVRALIGFGRTLVAAERFRLPRANAGDCVLSEEQWAEAERHAVSVHAHPIP